MSPRRLIVAAVSFAALVVLIAGMVRYTRGVEKGLKEATGPGGTVKLLKERVDVPPFSAPALDGRTHVLVRLAALLALGAPTASVRWAVELASDRGASDATLAAVLLSTASDAGGAQLAWSASRLALALDIDLNIEE